MPITANIASSSFVGINAANIISGVLPAIRGGTGTGSTTGSGNVALSTGATMSNVVVATTLTIGNAAVSYDANTGIFALGNANITSAGLAVPGTLSASRFVGNGFGLSSLNLANVIGAIPVINGGTGTTSSTGTGNLVLSSGPTVSNVTVGSTLAVGNAAVYDAGSGVLAFRSNGANIGNVTSTGLTMSGTVAANALSVISSAAGTYGSWTTRSTPLTRYWADVCWGSDKFVAVAPSGVMTSPDGITWTSQTPAANDGWNGVCWGSGIFVAVSTDGTVMTSPDGITWTSRTAAAANAWSKVCYGNGLFVAVAQSGTGNRVMTSPDGITWTARTSAADDGWMDVCWGSDKFVAVSYSGTVMTSPNGITWTLRTAATSNSWRSVCWGYGLFVAVANSGTGNRVMTSPDGITWTSRSSAADNYWARVTWGNSKFVAVGVTGTGNRVMTSPDGITWTTETSAVDNAWRGVCYGSDKFVAVSDSGSGNQVMTSTYTIPYILNAQIRNGLTWTSRTSASDNNWKSVCWGNNLFVAVSNTGTGNRVMTSPDGITWTARTPATDNNWVSVCYGNGLFVAVANSGTGNRVMTSPDGITWTSRTSAADNYWVGVCWGGPSGSQKFVAVAWDGTGNRVMTSPDGITWTARASVENREWHAVCWGYDKFVAVSGYPYVDSNFVMTSPDGITWTSRTSPDGYGLENVCWGNGLFVAVGGGVVVTSRDGIDWTRVTIPSGDSWYGIAWGGPTGSEQFVAVSAQGTVMTSPDGITWTLGTSAVSNQWYSVCWGSDKFVAVSQSGSGNRVMTSSATSTPSLGIGTVPGAGYQLDLSLDTARKLTTTTWTTGSDERIKEDIELANLELCRDLVDAIPLKRFAWKTSYAPTQTDRHQLGWIAQDVEAAGLAKAVETTNEHGYEDFKSLNPDQLYKVMWGALQKNVREAKELQDRINFLSRR